MSRRNRDKAAERIKDRMQKKLAVLFAIILVAFVVLGVRLYIINRDNGDRYKKIVLSQQEYDSIVLPAKRGEIVDRNGSKLAVSQKVYNIVVDAKALNREDGVNIGPTLSAIYSCDADFLFSENELRDYIFNNPGSQYRVIAKKISYDNITPLMNILNNPADNPNVKGVWLEETYQRQYPYDSLACDVIGFVQGDNQGAYGLEEYYNSLLVGTNGREYGYLNDDSNLERTIKPAENGRNLVSTIDVNIQSIVEKHILAFNEEHKNEWREGNGSENTGVIIMNPNNGEILAMASYPTFNLNDPRNTDGLKIEVSEEYSMRGIRPNEELGEESEDAEEAEEDNEDLAVSEKSEDEKEDSNDTVKDPSEASKPAGFDENEENDKDDNSPKTYEEAYELAKTEALNSLWKNFCVNSTYEPGSTMKPFTMAMALEEGIYSGNENFNCNGSKDVGDHTIHCNNRLGHGALTFSGALEQSCNVALMDIGASIGRKKFLKYSKIFNFGLKTNVDLTGEALTNSLVFTIDTMNPTDLAISSFGQGFNVTMIQMITGFCSLINGGYYYQPHIVSKIQDDTGSTITTVEPRVLKQTISQETSDKIVELCNNVVSVGTGKSARPAGYMIGGKTGTAEKYPRGTGNYVVSFMGFAPADNPQIAIYTVIDTPNVEGQASAKYATLLTRDILTEVLPYMHVFMTEELSESEQSELQEKQLLFSQDSTLDADKEEEVLEDDGSLETVDTEVIQIVENEESGNDTEKPKVNIDPDTGYAIDPTTGVLLDPQTGEPVDGNVSNL